jgi:adenosylcobinamide-phosphate synthase
MNALAAAAGVVADRYLGEPPSPWHPVVWYGTVMTKAEHHLYRDRRSSGVAFTALGMSVGVGAGLVLRRAIGPRAATLAATSICIAGNMLDAEARTIAQFLTTADLPAARARLRSLAGRTATDLDEHEICRAVVESLAENGVDAVAASVFWAAVGGAPAVFAHRAINTVDAMVGHHSDRYENFGWASARLDDVVNFLPARLMAVAVAAVTPAKAKEVWRIVRRDARAHPSPNGGVIEAAFAAALDVRLGGINVYGDTVENRGTLGDGAPADANTVARAIRLRQYATTAVAGGLVATQVAARVLKRRRCGERFRRTS